MLRKTHGANLLPNHLGIERFFLIILLTAFSVSCSGGSTKGPGEDGSLSGDIYVRDGIPSINFGDIYAIDARTRVTRLITRPFPNPADYSFSTRFLTPQILGAEDFLFGVNGCVQVGNDNINYCIERVDADRNIERLFRMNDRQLQAPPAMSPSGNLIAIVESYFLNGPTYLSLYTASGALLEQFQISESSRSYVSNFVWTEDERLIYGLSIPGTTTLIVVTEPGSLALSEDHRLGSLVVDTEGAVSINTVALSSDENLIAYDVNRNPREVHIVDLTTGDTTPLNANNEYDVFEPVWSPDGRYLLVTHNNAGGGSGVGVGADGTSTNPFQMLIEWNGTPVDINVFADDRTVDEGGQLFNFDPGEAFPIQEGLFRDEWIFNDLKSWLP